jgi:hypothetical protein
MEPPARHAASRVRVNGSGELHTWPADVGILHAEVGVPAPLHNPQARAVNGGGAWQREATDCEFNLLQIIKPAFTSITLSDLISTT